MEASRLWSLINGLSTQIFGFEMMVSKWKSVKINASIINDNFIGMSTGKQRKRSLFTRAGHYKHQYQHIQYIKHIGCVNDRNGTLFTDQRTDGGNTSSVLEWMSSPIRHFRKRHWRGNKTNESRKTNTTWRYRSWAPESEELGPNSLTQYVLQSR